MISWVISILVLGLLVLLHEFGHFVVARWFGVRVERFSVGFGPVLWRWKPGETEYAVSLLPLGGYVKLAGEHQTERQHAPDEFLSKPTGARAAIIFAGPLVNALISVVALWTVLVVGYPELLPKVGRLLDDMPAKAAGLQLGDRVTAINGKPIRTWEELTQTVYRSPEIPLALQIDRNGAPVEITISPKAKDIRDPFGRHKSVGLIGVAPNGEFETYRLGPLEASRMTMTKQAEWLSQIALSLWSMVTGRMSMRESLTGPIGIMVLTSEAARMGFGPLLYLMSIFSLSLAVFNLFPIPVLDGGHLLFLALERLRGRPVSLRVQERSAQVSMALLLFLVMIVCANDLQRLGVIDKVKGWITN